MSDSRENSPDWLREFQAPTQKLFTLSSASESSPEVSPTTSDDSYHEEYEGLSKKRDTILIDSGEDCPVVKAKKAKPLKIVKKKNLKEEAHEEASGEEYTKVKVKTVKAPRTGKYKNLKEDTHGENPTEEDTNVKAGKVKTPQKENNKILKEEAHEEVPTEEDARDKPAGPSAPTQILFTLSPASESSPELSLTTSDDSYHAEYEGLSKKQDTILIDSGEDSPVVKAKKPKTLKTVKKKNQKEEVDEEVSAEEDLNVEVKKLKAPKIGKIKNLKEETHAEILTEEDTSVKARKVKSPTKEKNKLLKEDVHEEFPAEEDTRDEPAGPSVISRLPLVFPEKVQRSKVLVECDGDAIDLSGDVGAVGRIVISNDPAGRSEMLLDLKGNIYKSTIVPSRTFCIVSVGQSEAKIEAIMNDFVQLEPQSNVFEAETMIEGTLDGFSFDSDEGEKIPKPSAHQSDQNVENGKQTSTVKKRKPEKSQGAVKKKAKAAGRPPKTVKKTKMSKK